MLILLLTVDSSNLSRVSKGSFSQQSLMELLIAEMPMYHYWGAFGDANGYFPIEGWSGVKLNKDGEVDHIEWRDHELEGTMRLEFLPFSIRCFESPYNNIEGTLDSASLPPSLLELMLRSNLFHGSVDVSGFSNKIGVIILFENSFSGCIDLPALPKQVRIFNIGANKFCGSLDLTSLSNELTLLRCEDNLFSGRIDLSHIPKGIRGIILNGNKFAQSELHVGSIGDTTKIDISGNAIDAVFDSNGSLIRKSRRIVT